MALLRDATVRCVRRRMESAHGAPSAIGPLAPRRPRSARRGGRRASRISEGRDSLASFDIDDRSILRWRSRWTRRPGSLGSARPSRRSNPRWSSRCPRHHAHRRYDGLAWVAYPKLEGISGRDLLPPDDARPAMAEALGGFLRALHETKPPAGVPHGHRLVPWRGRAEELPRMSSVIETEAPDLVNEETLPYLRGEIDPPPGSDVRVLCHGDLKGAPSSCRTTSDGSPVSWTGTTRWSATRRSTSPGP